MAAQSKIEVKALKEMIIDLLIGSKKKKILTATILVIIGYLIHMKNQKSATEAIKLKDEKDKKKVFP